MTEKLIIGTCFVPTPDWNKECGKTMPIGTVLQRLITDKNNVIKYIGCFYTGLRSQKDKEILPKIEWFSDHVYWRETGISKMRQEIKNV
jgi:hypothetical protein